MTEQLPRHDQGMRNADGSAAHDMRAPAVLHFTREGRHEGLSCGSAADAMLLAMEMHHRHDAVPDRIVLADGAEIGAVAIRQEYERMLALGQFG